MRKHHTPQCVEIKKQFSQIKEQKNSGFCKFQSVLMRYGNIESYQERHFMTTQYFPYF